MENNKYFDDMPDYTNNNETTKIEDTPNITEKVEDKPYDPYKDLKFLTASAEQSKAITKGLMFAEDLIELPERAVVMLDKYGVPIPNWLGESAKKDIDTRWGYTKERMLLDRQRQEYIDSIYQENPEAYTTLDKLGHSVIGMVANPLNIGQMFAKLNPVVDLGLDLIDTAYDEQIRNENPDYVGAMTSYGATRLALGGGTTAISKGIKASKELIQTAKDNYARNLANQIFESKLVAESLSPNSKHAMNVNIRDLLDETYSKNTPKDLSFDFQGVNLQTINIQNQNLNTIGKNVFIDNEVADYVNKGFKDRLSNMEKANISNNKLKEEYINLIDRKNEIKKKIKDLRYTPEDMLLKRQLRREQVKVSKEANEIKYMINMMDKSLGNQINLLKGIDKEIQEDIMNSTTPFMTHYNNVRRGVIWSETNHNYLYDIAKGNKKVLNNTKLNTLVNEVNENIRMKSTDSRFNQMANNYIPLLQEVNATVRSRFQNASYKGAQKLGDILPEFNYLNAYEIGNTFLAPYKNQKARLYNFYVSNMSVNGVKVAPEDYLKYINSFTTMKGEKEIKSFTYLSDYIIDGKRGDAFMDKALSDYETLNKMELGLHFKDLDDKGLLAGNVDEDFKGMRIFRDLFGTQSDKTTFDFSKTDDMTKYVNMLDEINNNKSLEKLDNREVKIFLRNIVYDDLNINKSKQLIDSVSSKIKGEVKLDEAIDIVAKEKNLPKKTVEGIYRDKKVIDRYYKDNNAVDYKFNLVMRNDQVIAFGEKFYFDKPDSAGFAYSKVKGIKVLDSKRDEFNEVVRDYLYNGIGRGGDLEGVPILNKPEGVSVEEAFARLMLELKRTNNASRFSGNKRSLGSLIGDEFGFTGKEALKAFLRLDSNMLKDNTEIMNEFLVKSTEKQALWIEYGTSSKFRVAGEAKMGIRDRIGELPEIQDKIRTSTAEGKVINTLNEIIDRGIRSELGITTKTLKFTGEGLIDKGIEAYRFIKRAGGGYDELLATPNLVAGLQTRYASKKHVIQGIGEYYTNKLMDAPRDLIARFLGSSQGNDLGKLGDINFKYNSDYLGDSFKDKLSKSIQADNLGVKTTIDSATDMTKKLAGAGDILSDNITKNINNVIITKELSDLPKSFKQVGTDLQGVLIRNGITENNYSQFRELATNLYKELGGTYNIDKLYNLADGNKQIKQFLNVLNNYTTETSSITKNIKYWNKGIIINKLASVNRSFMRAQGTEYLLRTMHTRNSKGILVPRYKGWSNLGRDTYDWAWQTINYGLNGAINNATRIALVSGIGGTGALVVGWEAFKQQLGISSSNSTSDNIKASVETVLVDNNPIGGLMASASDVSKGFVKSIDNFIKLWDDNSFGNTGIDKWTNKDNYLKVLEPSMKPSYLNMYHTLLNTILLTAGQDLTNDGYQFKGSFLTTPEQEKQIQLKLNTWFAKNISQEDIKDVITVENMMKHPEDRDMIITKVNNMVTKEARIEEANAYIIKNKTYGYDGISNIKMKQSIDNALSDLKVKEDYLPYVKSVIYRAYVSADSTQDIIDSIKDKLGLDLSNYIQDVDLDYITKNKQLSEYCIYKYLIGNYTLNDAEMYDENEVPQEYKERVNNIMKDKRKKKLILDLYR